MIKARTQVQIEIQAGAPLRLENAHDWTLQVVAGLAWLTYEGDPRDILLVAGESCRIKKAGLTVVEALAGQPVLLQITRGRYVARAQKSARAEIQVSMAAG